MTALNIEPLGPILGARIHDIDLSQHLADEVIDAVRRCWASLYTDRATAYREEMGYPHDSVEMCVVVQKMVHPKASGVAFTLNPADGDRWQINRLAP